jgi:dihydroxyacetone kinase-like predicted kinase
MLTLDGGMNVAHVLDAPALRRWCGLAADDLAMARERIDALNVFPVPDGDTGSNLHATLLSMHRAVQARPAGSSAADLWRAMSRGALLGARGNSGVIVSQFIRGLGEGLGDADRADGPALAGGLSRAAALARAAVSHPVEGTMLTVASDAARHASQAARHTAGAGGAADRPDRPGGLVEVAAVAAAAARAALARTPAQLAVLRESGVVDAGGAGLCVILDALVRAVGRADGGARPAPAAAADRPSPTVPPPQATQPTPATQPKRPAAVYEVSYLLRGDEDTVPVLRDALDRVGDSVAISGHDGLFRVHVHTGDPAAAIGAAGPTGRAREIRVSSLAGPGPGGTGGRQPPSAAGGGAATQPPSDDRKK